MNQNDLIFLKKWFFAYAQSFFSSDVEHQRNISLKATHTHKVCENIVQIAQEQHLSSNEIMLAETSALFHDVGRFPQYAKYNTFNDSISVNHGKFGADILQQEKVFQSLPDTEQELVIHTVKYHNAYTVPRMKNSNIGHDEDSMKITFLKLIRDADKLDILRVFNEYYETDENDRSSVAAHGLPDTPGYSEKILSHIYKKKHGSMKDVKTINDLKLMHLSWIYDLNFNTSFRLLLERKYVRKIIEKLPETEEIARVSLHLHEFARKKAF
jgi:hypothetical protein